MARVLITGAAGVLGKAVTRLLESKPDVTLRLTDVIPAETPHEFVTADLAKPDQAKPLCADIDQVLHIGSDASIKGIPGMSCYCAAKFALRGFTLALRQEFIGSGLRFNLVMPGPVNTTIISKTTDHWEYIQPEDVADVVRQLIVLPRTADVWEILVEPGDRPKASA
ncbi:MAG: hypothetical protein A3K19_32540 [Lentisphaerae bacterium RIFOXYB12_FULL_65_16]|nr:MAG: hypothetical protein A3K18_08025 [Lentisphaerae bacterium RIFOXYA12_64_32]OGV84426.1 MAG: hypothetical protein A3K19_32540 [Lentisphaerae bacterium RIFOXYB12_FULL_65_16]